MTILVTIRTHILSNQNTVYVISIRYHALARLTPCRQKSHELILNPACLRFIHKFLSSTHIYASSVPIKDSERSYNKPKLHQYCENLTCYFFICANNWLVIHTYRNINTQNKNIVRITSK